MRSSSSAGSDLGRTEVIIIVGVVSGMAGILLVALTITCLCCFTQLRKRGRLHSCDVHSTLSLDTSLFRMNEYWRHNWLVHQRNVLHPGTIRTTNQESVLPSQLADDVSYLYRQVRCPKPKRSSKVNSSMSYSEATQHQNEKDEQVYDNIQNAIRRLGSSMAISSAGSSLKKGNNSTAMNGDNHQQCPRKGQANKYVGDMMVSCPTKHPMDSIVGDTDVDEDVFFEQRL
ncbi:uncharacterized protein LOC110465254 [Mizuhopecten yessoensis]|uniref:Uncharacterized protein n=1 Tax=Mizuhopecten yessoensis TaxID=6573 RepID=A0A210R1Z8_MIZYE|nr:uncharacterized protein LOC110465254 [Mizuhopecten yessoensis]OWF55009.1 hypothetical protein KP79_PYT09278 [Mizuhopecten yessoensis]